MAITSLKKNKFHRIISHHFCTRDAFKRCVSNLSDGDSPSPQFSSRVCSILETVGAAGPWRPSFQASVQTLQRSIVSQDDGFEPFLKLVMQIDIISS